MLVHARDCELNQIENVSILWQKLVNIVSFFKCSSNWSA